MKKRVVYCMFLIDDFLCYALGVGSNDDSYQYVWFCNDITLAMPFCHSLDVG